jgi:hypothetical protein
MSDVEMIGGDRPVRVCDVCGGIDDHPRHVIAGDPGTHAPSPAIVRAVVDGGQAYPPEVANALLEDLLDTSSQNRHLDCCRSVGCPGGSCDVAGELVDGAAGLRGADLLAHLVDNRDQLQAAASAKGHAEQEADVAAQAADQLAQARTIVAAAEGGQS